MSSLPSNMKVLAVALLMVHGWDGFSSTAVFIVTKSGIAAATDGKSISGQTGQTSGTLQKLVLLHSRILVAQIGLAELRTNKKALRAAIRRGQPMPKWVMNFVPYSFPEWIMGIEKSTPPDISVAMLADTVKNKADRTFGVAAPLLKEMAMQHQPPFQDDQSMVATYVLAGFDENHVPTIYSVTIELNRDDLSLLPGKIEHVHPVPGTGSVDDRFYMPAGSFQTAIAPIVKEPQSAQYNRIPLRAKNELAQLHNGQAIAMTQVNDFLTVLISEEIIASSDSVGWPIWIGNIPRRGNSTLTRIPKPTKGAKL